MSRYCPYCGAVVPKNNLNCPQCLKDVDREDFVNEAQHMNHRRTREEYKEQLGLRRKSHALSMILAVIPAFFGILGLAQIYQDRRDPKGWTLLAIGLVMWLIMSVMVFAIGFTALLAAFFLAVPLIIFALVYVCTAVVCIIDAYCGSFGRFGPGF